MKKLSMIISGTMLASLFTACQLLPQQQYTSIFADDPNANANTNVAAEAEEVEEEVDIPENPNAFKYFKQITVYFSMHTGYYEKSEYDEYGNITKQSEHYSYSGKDEINDSVIKYTYEFDNDGYMTKSIKTFPNYLGEGIDSTIETYTRTTEPDGTMSVMVQNGDSVDQYELRFLPSGEWQEVQSSEDFDGNVFEYRVEYYNNGMRKYFLLGDYEIVYDENGLITSEIFPDLYSIECFETDSEGRMTKSYTRYDDEGLYAMNDEIYEKDAGKTLQAEVDKIGEYLHYSEYKYESDKKIRKDDYELNYTCDVSDDGTITNFKLNDLAKYRPYGFTIYEYNDEGQLIKETTYDDSAQISMEYEYEYVPFFKIY